MKSVEVKSFVVFVLFSLLVFAVAFILLKDVKWIVDEGPHYFYIQRLLNGDFIVSQHIAMLPGYHVVMAALAYVLNISSLPSIRFLTMVFTYSSILAFLSLLFLTKNYAVSPFNKALQYIFFPIYFSHLFLVYTDHFSLLLIFISLYFLFKQQYTLAGIIGIASCLTRQNNIIWMLFMLVYAYHDKFGFKFSLEILKSSLKEFWVFLFALCVFWIFVFLNDGKVTINNLTGQIHPSFSFHFGNIYFLLFTFFYLFLPLNIANRAKINDLVKQNKWVILWLLVFFVFYMLTFVNDNPNNSNPAGMYYYVNHTMLIIFTSSVFLKVLFFIPIAYSVLSIAVTELHKKSDYLLYPFTILFLMPSWMVSTRYHMIPLILFLLFRKESSKSVEYSTIALYMISAAVLFFGISNHKIFI
jgi:alpha-1,2-glucosyltransferase